MSLKSLFLLIITTMLMTPAVTIADEDGMIRYRNFSPAQVRDMSDKQRSSTMPMTYIFAAQRGLSVDSELLFGMQLNKLMYSGIQDYRSAIKAFQADLGDPQTGELTVYQIHQLEYRSQMQGLSRVMFPDEFKSFKGDDYGFVEGTLTILDERIAWPINNYQISCFRSQNMCEVQQVMLDLPSKDSWVQQYQVMIDSTEYYNVNKWTKDTIDADFPSKPDSCRTTSLSLNFKTKEFFLITKNAGGKCEILGQPMPKLTKPRISQVVDGKKIFEEEFAKIQRLAYDLLASDFRKKVSAADAKAMGSSPK